MNIFLSVVSIQWKLFDPAPVFTALNAVHGHFADVVFLCQLFDRQLTVLACQRFLDRLYLGRCQF